MRPRGIRMTFNPVICLAIGFQPAICVTKSGIWNLGFKFLAHGMRTLGKFVSHDIPCGNDGPLSSKGISGARTSVMRPLRLVFAAT